MLSELGPSVRAQSNSGVTDRQRGREKKGRAGLVCRITYGARGHVGMLILCERVRPGLCTHKEGTVYFVTEDSQRHTHTFFHVTHAPTGCHSVSGEIREGDTKFDVKVARKSALKQSILNCIVSRCGCM